MLRLSTAASDNAPDARHIPQLEENSALVASCCPCSWWSWAGAALCANSRQISAARDRIQSRLPQPNFIVCIRSTSACAPSGAPTAQSVVPKGLLSVQEANPVKPNRMGDGGAPAYNGLIGSVPSPGGRSAATWRDGAKRKTAAAPVDCRRRTPASAPGGHSKSWPPSCSNRPPQ